MAPSGNDEELPEELVAALCHEVGNQLAALRLTGHVLKYDKTKDELEARSQSVEELATHAGSIVGLIGPLIGASKSSIAVVNPLDLLEGLSRTLPDAVVDRVEIVLPEEGEISEVVGNFHMLSGLLLALVLGSCEASSKESVVKVSLEERPQEVAALIEDSGAVKEVREGSEGMALRGRELMLAVANRLLARVEGGVEIEGCGPESKETRLRVVLSRESSI